jgi:hypothetical protein
VGSRVDEIPALDPKPPVHLGVVVGA